MAQLLEYAQSTKKYNHKYRKNNDDGQPTDEGEKPGNCQLSCANAEPLKQMIDRKWPALILCSAAQHQTTYEN